MRAWQACVLVVARSECGVHVQDVGELRVLGMLRRDRLARKADIVLTCRGCAGEPEGAARGPALLDDAGQASRRQPRFRRSQKGALGAGDEDGR